MYVRVYVYVYAAHFEVEGRVEELVERRSYISCIDPVPAV
jgi:hypothetical protein